MSLSSRVLPSDRAGRTRLAIVGLGMLAVTVGGAWLAWSISRIPDTPAPRARRTGPSPLSAALPTFDHVYIVVLENHPFEDVVGAPAAPYLNALIARAGLATEWIGVARPSQPNYVALIAGETLNLQDNLDHDFNERTIVDQLEEKGMTWRVFAENVPLNCYTGESAHDGPDGSGTYARKHEPVISFRQVSENPARCANITDFSHFAPGAVNFNLIVPNLCHDMHDCSVADGDAFLAGFIPRIVDAPSGGPNDLLVVTFDEGNPNDQKIGTVVISDRTLPGVRSTVQHDHYSLLRTLEASWGLGCLANACTANDIGESFAPIGSVPSPPP